MNEDQFDALVDDATHAVNNLIPDRYLGGLGDAARSDLLIAINDALTPILRDTIASVAPHNGNRTRASTIAAAIVELFETHAAKCDESAEVPEDRPAHIVSEVHDTSANIDSIASCDVEGVTQIYMVLDDGAAFRITVEAVQPRSACDPRPTHAPSLTSAEDIPCRHHPPSETSSRAFPIATPLRFSARRRPGAISSSSARAIRSSLSASPKHSLTGTMIWFCASPDRRSAPLGGPVPPVAHYGPRVLPAADRRRRATSPVSPSK